MTGRLALLMIGWLSVAPLALRADEPAPTDRNRRVAVLPLRDFAVQARTLWIGTATADKHDPEALGRYLTRRLAVEPSLDVVDVPEIARRVDAMRLPREEGRLGLERMDLGLALYKDLRVQDAVPHLEQAEQALQGGYFDILDPARMSDLYLTLALCYLEQGKAHKTHVALKEMFFRTPQRQFKKGFYSQRFEKALVSAVTDFAATWPKDNPLGGRARLDRLARDLDVDSMIFGWLEHKGGALQMRLVVHDRIQRSVSYRSHFVSSSNARDLERIDRFVSSWTTCTPMRIGGPVGPEKPSSEFFLDTAFSYNVFATLLGESSLTSRPFSNLGMAITGEWQFLNGLGAFAQLNMLISTQDPARELTDSFPSLRVAAGMSYAMQGDWWRVFVRFGVDAQFLLGEFVVANDPWCQWDLVHQRCNANELARFSDEYMVGFAAAIGGQFFVSKPLYVTVRFGVAGYILPSDRVDLDFPLSFETGLGYKF